MKVTNVLKNVGVGLLVTMLVGCASVGSVANQIVNNKDRSGIIYGASFVTSTSAAEVCDATNNKDSRCANANDYVVVMVYSEFGFAKAGVGVNALVKKDFPNLGKLKYNGRLGDKVQPYSKAKVIPGQFGELLEVVSVNGDGKCVWSGLPRAGGTVCDVYNWDYRKDNQAALNLR